MGRAPVRALAITIAFVVRGFASAAEDSNGAGPWHKLETGLELGVFSAPMRSQVGDSLVRIVRIDPQRFELRLLTASAPAQGRSLTAKEWCQQNGLVAAINASMYQGDYKTSVSLMKTKAHTNNPRVSKDNAILAFDRHDDGVPAVQIIDRQHQNFDELRPRYGSLVQSIRMVSFDGRNVWQPDTDKASMAAIGIDRQGRVLFVHVRSPYSTHDIVNMLLGLPIDLKNAMYTEGGSEAQLYVRSGSQEFEFVGWSETGFMEIAENAPAWPIPNIIGIARVQPDSH